ncbi:MAG: MBOAT family O-acyltransferase [Desulfobaccales bacterium]
MFNYTLGRIIARLNKNNLTDTKSFNTIVLVLAIGVNLGALAYFKYMDFFIANVNYFTKNQISFLHIALPLGISFFTFTQIAYLVDVYKNIAEEYNILNYILFVTFFPHLIAGPIIHHKEMMPQFSSLKSKKFNYRNFSQGLYLFIIGLCKKIIIADSLSGYVTQGFTSHHALTTIEAWLTSLSYTLQIYFDFSGYTDMALGLALMFNIWLPVNFNSPYKALDIQDFWRRWHITLSRFLRAYVYIPLGGNRRGNYLTYCNLMATFLLGGLWHGAGWTFLFWGFLHGLAMVVHRIWRLFNRRMPRMLAWFLTFNFINICWVFFRAENWDEAIKVLRGMFFFNGTVLPNSLQFKWLASLGFTFGPYLQQINGNDYTVLMIIASLLLCLYFRNSNQLSNNFEPKWQIALITAIMAFVAVINIDKTQIFLYYKF